MRTDLAMDRRCRRGRGTDRGRAIALLGLAGSCGETLEEGGRLAIVLRPCLPLRFRAVEAMLATEACAICLLGVRVLWQLEEDLVSKQATGASCQAACAADSGANGLQPAT